MQFFRILRAHIQMMRLQMRFSLIAESFPALYAKVPFMEISDFHKSTGYGAKNGIVFDDHVDINARLCGKAFHRRTAYVFDAEDPIAGRGCDFFLNRFKIRFPSLMIRQHHNMGCTHPEPPHKRGLTRHSNGGPSPDGKWRERPCKRRKA